MKVGVLFELQECERTASTMGEFNASSRRHTSAVALDAM